MSRSRATGQRRPQADPGRFVSAPLALLLSGTALGCAVHRVRHDPKPPVRVPAAYHAASHEPQGRQLPERWWQEFSDRDLDRLVDATLRGNFDLRAAWARLAQARAASKQAGAPRWPGLELRATGTYQRFLLGRFGTLQSRQNNNSLAASYELDLWGKLSSGAAAALQHERAAGADLAALAMSLAAEVSERWFDLARSRAQQALLAAQQQSNETFLELVMLRFNQGQASALDVFQQRELLAGNRAELELLRASEAMLRNQLAILAGRTPGTLTAQGHLQLPEPLALPGLGLPSHLLQRRPDVRAAMHRVQAVDHQLAQAVADRYPSLRLSASGSLQANNLSDQALTPLWNLAANLLMPLIDGGRRAAEVERQRALLAERVSAYGRVVLLALLEVENALVQERQQRAHIEALKGQLEVSQANLREARHRYSQGLSDFLPVLTSLRATQQTERRLLDARRQLLSHRIQLCRALGGTWTRSLPRAGSGHHNVGAAS